MTPNSRRAILSMLPALGMACAANSPPDVAPLSPMEVTVGDTLTVPLRASDPDGDAVRFEVTGAPGDAEVREGDPWTFVVTPAATDAAPGGKRYDLTVVARDSHGGRTSVPAVLTVLPEGSVPAFEGPAAWTLDLSQADHVAVPVRVRDDDTAEVRLALDRPLEGATFEVWDGHRASLYWKPTAAQVAGGTLWTFTVSADDGTHRVVQEFAILLVNADLFGGCPGTPPVATHEPPAEKVGPGPIPLEVTASDAESRVASVECRWTATGDEAYADRNLLRLEAGADGTFRGDLPDLSAAAAQGLVVLYACTATDDDDPASGACDHARRVPKSGDFAVSVRRDASAPCRGDGTGADAGGTALAFGETAALRLCDGRTETFTVDLAAGSGVAAAVRPMSTPVSLRLVVRGPSGQVLAEGVDRVRATAQADGTHRLEISPAGTAPVTYALLATPLDAPCADDPDDGAPLAAGITRGDLCPAAATTRTLHLEAGESARLTLSFDPAAADLDLALLPAGGGTPLRLSDGTGATERLSFEADAPTDLAVRVSSADVRGAAWRLDARIDSAACGDDLLAPNGTPDLAPALPEGAWDNLRLCPGTADHVRLGLNGGESLDVVVETAAGGDALPLAILAADGTVLADGTPDGSSSTAHLDVPGPGDLVLRVGPAPAGAPSYTLAFAAEDPPGTCRPDRMEPNDAPGTAPSLPDGFTTHLTLCAGDLDTFAFRMAPWQTLSAFVLAGTASPHAVLQTLAGETLAGGEATSYGESLVSVAREEGTVVLVLDAPEPGWYDVAISRE